jgi:hypothetical protein
VRYAQTLFNLYVVRCLTLLNMRLWDEGMDAAAARRAQNQAVLDQLWKTSPADQPALVRNVRWLIPVAHIDVQITARVFASCAGLTTPPRSRR